MGKRILCPSMQSSCLYACQTCDILVMFLDLTVYILPLILKLYEFAITFYFEVS